MPAVASRAYRGPTLYGVLGLSVLLGSANTATPFGASNAVALTVVDSEVFLFLSAHITNHQAQARPDRPVNGVDVPVLGFSVETPTCLAVRASPEVSGHQVP
jgi:hypothetical protein